MTSYEELLEKSRNDDLCVYENYDFSNTRIKGLYCDGNIALSRDLETDAERACVLAEELGHHYTTVGDILDQSDVRNRKQERLARLWAYNQKAGLLSITAAYEAGCTTLHEMAEYLGVTPVFLIDAIEAHRNRYGCYTIINGFIIIFEPCLTIIKRQ